MKKKFLFVLAFSILALGALPAHADLHMYCKINGVEYELGDVIKRFGNYSKAVIGCCDLTKVCGPNYISNVEGDEYLHSLSLIAAKYNHLGSLKYLIDVKGVGYESWPMKKGSDGHYRDYKDYTQLMYAIKNGNADMVAYLLKKGANPRLSNQYGEDAKDIAEGTDNSEVKELVREAWSSYRYKLDIEYKRDILDLKNENYDDIFAGFLKMINFDDSI
ncbi:ankyrin repeat domain-containing protein [Candidatus Proelusimicrobium volucris]|uniref:ankyrin repeat domain-containing protein n=1 Tax=Candidatus Proelusimicrobium volucris TaxID=3416225 RepID=UPI003D0D8F01